MTGKIPTYYCAPLIPPIAIAIWFFSMKTADLRKRSRYGAYENNYSLSVSRSYRILEWQQTMANDDEWQIVGTVERPSVFHPSFGCGGCRPSSFKAEGAQGWTRLLLTDAAWQSSCPGGQMHCQHPDKWSQQITPRFFIYPPPFVKALWC